MLTQAARFSSKRVVAIRLAVNYKHLRAISNAISKPLRRYDSKLDYLPTQYICEYIKSLGYDGIQYKSTIDKDGVNLAVFNQANFECLKRTKYEVLSVNYKTKPKIK